MGAPLPAPPWGAPRQASGEIVAPAFGSKNHTGIGRAHGFIRRFAVNRVARHDGSQANLDLPEGRGLAAQFQRTRPRGKPMPAHIARGNATRARVRSRVEHVFGATKVRMGLAVCSIGVMRATAKIALANLAHDMRRQVWIGGGAAPA